MHGDVKQGHIGLAVLSDGKLLAPCGNACWARGRAILDADGRFTDTGAQGVR